MRRELALGALLAVLPSCWWQSLATDLEPVDEARPTAAPAPDGEPPAVGGEGADGAPTTAAAPLPPITDPEYALPPLERTAIANGLRLATRSWPRPGLAHLRVEVAVPAGDDRAAAALVTAWSVADAPRGDQGEPALRERIRELGGDLAVTVDARTARFDVTVPAGGWRAAAAATITALAATPTSARRLAETQERVVRDLIAASSADPMTTAIGRALDRSPGASALVDAVVDLDAAAVAVHHRLGYRPDAAVVALLVPGAAPRDTLAAAAEIGAAWPAATEQRPAVLAPLPLTGKIHWAGGIDFTEVALLRAVADPLDAASAADRVVLELVSRSGVGGRLGASLRSTMTQEIGFDRTPVAIGATRFELLRAWIPPELAPTVHDAHLAAIADLGQRPPSSDEIATAARRARFSCLAELDAPAGWLGFATRRLWDPAPAGESDDRAAAALAALAEPASLDVRAAITRAADAPATVIALGGTPGGGAVDRVALLDDVALAPTYRVMQADRAALATAGEEFVRKAIDAVGGAGPLMAVDGFAARSRTRTGVGPTTAESERFDGKSRRLDRSRAVLGTEIETSVGPDGGAETCRDQRVELTADEGRAEIEAIERHPILLLTECVRGRARYRLVTVREIDGRRRAVLERDDPTRERLRLHIDAESGLVRSVETREQRPGVGSVFVREDYRDYRERRGVRVPFYRARFLDDAARAAVTEWIEFDPRARAQ